jgi:hypothetical protein
MSETKCTYALSFNMRFNHEFMLNFNLCGFEEEIQNEGKRSLEEVWLFQKEP